MVHMRRHPICCVQEHLATLKARLLADHAAEMEASRRAAATVAEALHEQLSTAVKAVDVQRARRKKCKEQLRRCANAT